MATNLCHQNGRMEYWNVEDPDFIGAGILGVKAEINHFNCNKLLQTHHFYPLKLFSISQGPLLHHSTIPIGAKPLSSILSVYVCENLCPT